ncbi:unnamed protein product, partial [marine sediment metagenome]
MGQQAFHEQLASYGVQSRSPAALLHRDARATEEDRLLALPSLPTALLIGDFPAAWFEIYPYTMEINGTYECPSYNIFPTDLYYMDLNGSWIDNDGNGYFDEHTGDRGPEV